MKKAFLTLYKYFPLLLIGLVLFFRSTFHYSQYIFFPILLLYIILILSSKKKLVNNNYITKYSKYYILGTIYLIVTALFSFELHHPAIVMLNMIPICLLIFIISTYYNHELSLKIVLNVLLFSGFIYLVYVFPVIFNLKDSIYDLKQSIVNEESTIGNRNNIAQHLYYITFLVVISQYNKFLPKVLSIALLLILGYLILITFSTRAFMAYLFCFLAFSLKFFNIKTLFIYVIFLSVGLYILYSFNIPAVDNVIIRLTGFFGVEYESSAYTNTAYGLSQGQLRKDLLEDGFSLFLNNPFFGIGIENTRLYMHTYTHNDFLELLIGGGIFAPLFFYYAYFIVVKQAFSLSFIDKLFFILMFISLLIIAMAGNIYRSPIAQVLIITLILNMYLIKIRTN